MVLEQAPPEKPVVPESPAPTGQAAPSKQAAGPGKFILVGLVLVLAFVTASFAVRNSDFWLHLATGRLIAQGNYQIGIDPFCVSTSDVYWTNASWLFDVLAYAIHQHVGDAALVLGKALIVAALAWLLLQIRRPEQGLIVPVVVTTLAIVVMSPRFLMQPMVASLFFLGLTLWILHRASECGRPRALWLLPPLFLVWANIDAWFIFGPVVLACWLVGMLAERGSKTGLSPVLLGLVLACGLAACLVNPHFYRVFTLPPELAYIAVQAGDGMGMPEWMVAGGRTWQTLRDNDPNNFPLPLSPLSATYRNLAGFGNNIAGMAYFPLLILTTLSFFLRTMNGPRLAVWIPFALLSLAQARLIGFFAVVSGSVLVLNIQDFLRARVTEEIDDRLRNARKLAGVGVGILLAGLLVLAWPGWLNGAIGDYSSPRRVAWSIEPDESMRQATEKLAKLYEAGKVHQGLGLTVEFGNYLPWFAPGVKSFWDSRFDLFAGVVGDIIRLNRAPEDEALKGTPASNQFQVAEWRKLSRRYDLEFLVLANFQRAQPNRVLAARFWLDARHWPSLYQDGKTLVFGWNEPGDENRFAGATVDWNAAAFGHVPAEQRSPSHGHLDPEVQQPWQKYLDGWPSPPVELAECHLDLLYYQLFAQQWVNPYLAAWHVGSLSPAACMMVAVPGTVTMWPAMFHTNYIPNVRSLDAGPPAAPILMVRNARRSVAEGPAHPESFLAVANASNLLWKSQEDHWAQARARPAPLDYRITLRRLQVMGALKAYLQLEPTDSLVHESLADMYLQNYHLDVAHEHLVLALKYFDRRRPAGLNPQGDQEFRQAKDRFKEKVQRIEKDLQERKADFDLRAAGKPPLDKVSLAIRTPYKRASLDKEEVDYNGRGLVLDALAALHEIKSPSDQRESFVVFSSQTGLLLMMGELKAVGDGLPQVKELLGPTYFYYQSLWAAAIGNYAEAREAFTEQIKLIGLPQQAASVRDLLILNLAPRHNVADLTSQTVRFFNYQATLINPLQATANLHLLRGLMALEEGDTVAAAKDFQACLELSSNIYFPDRPIAERYRELLARQLRPAP